MKPGNSAPTPPAKVKPRPAVRVGDGSRNSRRGFASMDPAKQRIIASKGGKACQNSKQGHKWTPEEAREAGRKSGIIRRRGSATATPDN